jgi:hypothetical protein
MEKLARHFGGENIIWRYDPIVCWEEGGAFQSNFNRDEFERLCQESSAMGLTRCYFSYVTDYLKFRKRIAKKYPGVKMVPADQSHFTNILSDMQIISGENGISLHSCCNDSLIGANISKGHCISGEVLNQLAGRKSVSEAKTPTRTDCGCTRSIDIGDYLKQPCYFGCIYCYANPVWE